MTKASNGDEDDECFHDSLDRLISSSSALPSDDDDDDDDHHHASPDPVTVASMAATAASVSETYGIWISQPSSVEERRLTLLRKIGLAADASVLRHRPSLSAAEVFARSVSSDQLSSGEGFSNTDYSSSNDLRNSSEISCVSGFVRSKSEGNSNHNRSSSDYAACSSSVYENAEKISIDSVQHSSCNPKIVNNTQNHSRSISNVDLFRNGWGSVSPKKPPSGRCRSNSTINGGCYLGNEEVEEVEMPMPVCSIKNLDNGKEFVVNEVREDGMWNKLKEVGTGRQLTMEEFEMCVGTSPIVQELMRRQNVEDGGKDGLDSNANGVGGNGSTKTGSWLKSIKNVANSVAGYKERRSSDEKDTSSEKGGRRSSSATDDSQDVSFHGPERVRVRRYGKSCKELTALYKSQEINAHNGSIWTIKFSLDGKYLASAGEDCVIHVWQVTESERKGDLLLDDPSSDLFLLTNGSPEPSSISPISDDHTVKKRRGRLSISRKSVSLDQVLVPETVFALSEKPICSFQGHLNDVLDLSWSKSQHLLSSSMDKTVRLWHISSNSCLKIFSHSDYVTCIQFNPVDDRYFISGSLDAKVRIWSIPDRQVVDWNDLHEMVTAACYTPDGQSALVGSYKGSCHLYNTSENKLQQKGHINLQNKKKKSHQKKITGFQTVCPGSTSEVLVTSSDSRIRVIDGVQLVHKFKGFRNTNSQISASLSADGRYAVCASEDSHVYVWKHEGDSRPSRNKGVTVTQSYEHFYCKDVSVAIPWPGMPDTWKLSENSPSTARSSPVDCPDEVLAVNHPPTPVEETNDNECSSLRSGCRINPLNGTISSAMNNYFFDKMSATWPEEKLVSATKMHSSPRAKVDATIDLSSGVNQSKPAWGLVIVTAGVKGQIRTFQNFGLPVRI